MRCFSFEHEQWAQSASQKWANGREKKIEHNDLNELNEGERYSTITKNETQIEMYCENEWIVWSLQWVLRMNVCIVDVVVAVVVIDVGVTFVLHQACSALMFHNCGIHFIYRFHFIHFSAALDFLKYNGCAPLVRCVFIIVGCGCMRDCFVFGYCRWLIDWLRLTRLCVWCANVCFIISMPFFLSFDLRATFF